MKENFDQSHCTKNLSLNFDTWCMATEIKNSDFNIVCHLTQMHVTFLVSCAPVFEATRSPLEHITCSKIRVVC